MATIKKVVAKKPLVKKPLVKKPLVKAQEGRSAGDSTAYWTKYRNYMDSVSKTPRGIESDDYSREMDAKYGSNRGTYVKEAQKANKALKRQSKKGEPGYDMNGNSLKISKTLDKKKSGGPVKKKK